MRSLTRFCTGFGDRVIISEGREALLTLAALLTGNERTFDARPPPYTSQIPLCHCAAGVAMVRILTRRIRVLKLIYRDFGDRLRILNSGVQEVPTAIADILIAEEAAEPVPDSPDDLIFDPLINRFRPRHELDEREARRSAQEAESTEKRVQREREAAKERERRADKERRKNAKAISTAIAEQFRPAARTARSFKLAKATKTKIINALAAQLKNNKHFTRDAAKPYCIDANGTEAPERVFRDLWGMGRAKAGLDPKARAGRKPRVV
jgi:hypothetical protein